MSYKEKFKKIKGVSIKWDKNQVFPVYTYKSAPILSIKL